MSRTVILVAYTNRTAREKIRNANANDLQEHFRVVTDDADMYRALSYAPANARWVDLDGSDLSQEGKDILTSRYTKAASLAAAIAWLRMPVPA